MAARYLELCWADLCNTRPLRSSPRRSVRREGAESLFQKQNALALCVCHQGTQPLREDLGEECRCKLPEEPSHYLQMESPEERVSREKLPCSPHLVHLRRMESETAVPLNRYLHKNEETHVTRVSKPIRRRKMQAPDKAAGLEVGPAINTSDNHALQLLNRGTKISTEA